MRRIERGFTLVELLVVMAIIGILISLLVPAVGVVRETARRSKCANNLKQMMVAIANYESQKQVFPPGRVGCDSDEQLPCIDRRTGEPLLAYQRPSSSGFSQILPELDQAELFRMLRFEKGGILPSASGSATTGWQNIWSSGGVYVYQAIVMRPPVFVCPSSRDSTTNSWNSINMATGSYAMCMGSWGGYYFGRNGPHFINYENNGVFIYYRCRRASDVQQGDGLGNTIFLGETRDGGHNCWPVGIRLVDSLRATEWHPKWGGTYLPLEPHPLSPNSKRSMSGGFNSYHIGGCNFAFGDGHVQFLNDAIDIYLYRRLGSYNGSYDNSDSMARPPDVE